MNGYKLMAESYKKLLEQGLISNEEAEKEIRIFEFLATCDMDDYCRLVDSSAFNDIIMGYCEIAIIQGDTRGIFDTISAKDALESYYDGNLIKDNMRKIKAEMNASRTKQKNTESQMHL